MSMLSNRDKVLRFHAATFTYPPVTGRPGAWSVTRTEHSGHDADAVGEHDALDGVQVRQHEEHKQRQADGVKSLEQSHHEKMAELGPPNRLETAVNTSQSAVNSQR